MDRQTIRDRFRSENPEITDRVATDAVINGWMFDADKEICAETKCLVSNVPESFSSDITLQYYDLTARISKFYKIDEYPGGGVWYDNEPLTKATESEMNFIMRNWRSASSGIPRKYFLRGKYLWFDVLPDTADEDIYVSVVYVSDSFDQDASIPFNGLTYLEPFHAGIIKYLDMKAKGKIGKDQEKTIAVAEYTNYVKKMKKLISGSQNDKAFFVNRGNMGNSSQSGCM